MLKYNTIFQSDKDFRTFVSEAEKNYKDQIKKIANKIQEDEEIHKTKPNALILYTLKQRMEMISALRCVDKVVSYTQMDVSIKTIDFDILVVGPDQNHSGILRAIEWAKSHGKQVKVLPRTPGISSTEIRERILKK